MKASTLVLSVAVMSLTACSSLKYERRVAELTENRQDMSNWNLYQVRAWPKGTMPEDFSSPSDFYTKKVEAQCLASFSDGAKSIQSQLNNPGNGLDYKKYKLAQAEAKVVMDYAEQCADDLGADAHFRLVHEEKNSWYDLEGWVKTSRYYDKYRKLAAKDLVKAKERDRETTATVLGVMAVGAAAMAAGYSAGAGGGSSYVNPNQHWVSGYYRSDGTYVPGHWRTDPNRVCYDNINGCR
ncbi:hypothetical protein [Halomonas sp.]|uniref:hypothetical protein n=1 Tax=Halomonas sp. TaxID=1486246 RepID=UPI00298DDFD2|nr:hypothetical protein [Halomonas sp.]MDW7747021.1 hypothetical protein [Halomonas sp.]